MDESVRRWLLRFPDASDDEQNRRLRTLARFEATMQTTHDALLALLQQARKRLAEGQTPELKEVIEEFYRRLRKEGLQHNSAMVTCRPILSFFSANYVTIRDLSREIMRTQDNAWETTFVLTQDQVRRMVESRKSTRDKALIAFLAQTGQRVGVLTAMKTGLIRRFESDPHGIVEVPPNFKNPRGTNVNKYEVRYNFVIGEDTMRYIGDLTNWKEGWLFEGGYSKKDGISVRQIGRVVDEAAEAIGIQNPIQTEIAWRSMNRVHPHIFRRYWVERVTSHGMLETHREYMMGHKLPYRGTYVVGLLTDDKLVRAYTKAEANLSLRMPQENEPQAKPTEMSKEPEKQS